jgi:hypothetical protein
VKSARLAFTGIFIGGLWLYGCVVTEPSNILCTPSQKVRCNQCPETNGEVTLGWMQCSADGTKFGPCLECGVDPQDAEADETSTFDTGPFEVDSGLGGEDASDEPFECPTGYVSCVVGQGCIQCQSGVCNGDQCAQ